LPRRTQEANTAFRRQRFKDAWATAPVLQEGFEAKTPFRFTFLKDAWATAPVWQKGAERPTQHFESHVLHMQKQRRSFCKKAWKPRQPSEGHV
jgi:hypothetical protein